MAIQQQEYREQSYEIWEEMAPGWDRHQDFIWQTTQKVGEWLAGKVEARAGQTVLELAGGTGETGFKVAAALGNEGWLISSDFSPKMVEVAKKRGEELGLGNVEYRVLDAEKMDLEDDSVDGCVCRFGYMLMADPAQALRETHRVMRQGGRLCFAVWAGPDRNAWAAIPGMTLVELGHMPAPEPGDPGIFAMADPERVRELVTGAGFGSPQIEEVPTRMAFDEGFDQYWMFINEVAGPISRVIAGLSDEDEAKARALIEERVAQFKDGDGITIPGVALCALARSS